MGCGSSAEPATKPAPKAKFAPKPVAPKKNLNPADYMISKKTGECIVRSDGTINGEQFNIEESSGCDIFLFDNIACVFIDECKDCRIYLGPVESSVFLRNCSNVNVVVACQQFRSRDCKQCKMAMLCTTEPIIETSSDLQFACFDFRYFSLSAQLGRAGLQVWNNKWWQVHDFSKNADRPNWSLLPAEEAKTLLRLDMSGLSGDEIGMPDAAVPITLGSRPWPSQESCFVVFLPGSKDHVEAFLARIVRTPEWTLCRTRSLTLPDDRLKSFFTWAKDSKQLLLQCKGKELTGIEVCGHNSYEQVQAAFTSDLAAVAKAIRCVPLDQTPTLGKAFFEVWKDEI